MTRAPFRRQEGVPSFISLKLYGIPTDRCSVCNMDRPKSVKETVKLGGDSVIVWGCMAWQ
jgi:hypothetical protein